MPSEKNHESHLKDTLSLTLYLSAAVLGICAFCAGLMWMHGWRVWCVCAMLETRIYASTDLKLPLLTISLSLGHTCVPQEGYERNVAHCMRESLGKDM